MSKIRQEFQFRAQILKQVRIYGHPQAVKLAFKLTPTEISGELEDLHRNAYRFTWRRNQLALEPIQKMTLSARLIAVPAQRLKYPKSRSQPIKPQKIQRRNPKLGQRFDELQRMQWRLSVARS